MFILYTSYCFLLSQFCIFSFVSPLCSFGLLIALFFHISMSLYFWSFLFNFSDIQEYSISLNVILLLSFSFMQKYSVPLTYFQITVHSLLSVSFIQEQSRETQFKCVKLKYISKFIFITLSDIYGITVRERSIKSLHFKHLFGFFFYLDYNSMITQGKFYSLFQEYISVYLLNGFCP